MNDEITARQEQNALKELFQASTARQNCVCASKGSRYQAMAGWLSAGKSAYTQSIRVKGKKPGTEMTKQAAKSRLQGIRVSKTDSSRRYFRNYKSRKQHVESYRREFSTVAQNCEQVGDVTPQYVGDDDPYMPSKGDQRHLFKRLKLLQTLSDFYELGVSSRDLRRQAYLPPVLTTGKQIKAKYSTTEAQEKNDRTLMGIAKSMEDCQLKDVLKSDAIRVESEAASTDCGNSTPTVESSSDESAARQLNSCNSRTSSAYVQQPTTPQRDRLNRIQHSSILNNYLRDLRRPSQKIINGLHGSLKEELTILRSGSDINRNPHHFNVNGERFVDLKQKKAKSDHHVAIKEKTVNSIPNTREGKTLYISILGRNPLK